MFPHSSQEAAVQTQLVLAEGCVCMLRLSLSPFAAAVLRPWRNRMESEPAMIQSRPSCITL